FYLQAEDGIRVFHVTGVQTCALPILLAGPVPESYRLGAGDLLVLVLSGDVELVHNLEVTRDGFILIPQVGQLYVSSLSMTQVKRSEERRVGKECRNSTSTYAFVICKT